MKIKAQTILSHLLENGFDYDATIKEVDALRKSYQIDAKCMAVLLIAFTNADGGTATIGVENDGTIIGADGMQDHIKDLLRAGLDFCVPSI